MPYRSTRGGSRSKCAHLRQSGLPADLQSNDRIRQFGIAPCEAAASASERRQAGQASSSVEQVILQTLRARGGRLLKADLVFEVRWHGMHRELIDGVVDELVACGLLRGPLSESMAYELTVAGWDVCAAAIGAA